MHVPRKEIRGQRFFTWLSSSVKRKTSGNWRVKWCLRSSYSDSIVLLNYNPGRQTHRERSYHNSSPLDVMQFEDRKQQITMKNACKSVCLYLTLKETNQKIWETTWNSSEFNRKSKFERSSPQFQTVTYSSNWSSSLIYTTSYPTNANNYFYKDSNHHSHIVIQYC